MDAFAELVEDLKYWARRSAGNLAALRTAFDGLMSGLISGEGAMTIISGNENGKSFTIQADVTASKKRSAIRIALQKIDGEISNVFKGRIG